LRSEIGRVGSPVSVRHNVAHPRAVVVFVRRRRLRPSLPFPGASAACVRARSDAVDIDHGQLVRRGLKDVAIVMGLHEFAPVGGRAPGRRDGWWLKRFAQVREDFPDRPRLADRMSVATGGCKQCEGQGWFRTGKTG
jgi:hypothetical protein